MKNLQKYAYVNTDKCLNLKAIQEANRKPSEYKLWYEGNINEILKYYKTSRDIYAGNNSTYTPSFMRLVPVGYAVNIGGATQPNNFTVYHNPLANIISRAKTGLLFSTAPVITLQSKSKSRTEAYQEILDDIVKENELPSVLQTAAEYESYSGAVGFKPILDPDFSDYPLVQVYPKEEMIVNRKYGKVMSIIFMDEFSDKDDKFVLFSEYGKGYVKYRLVSKDNEIDVPMTRLEETAGLQDLYFYDNEGNVLDILLAIYKENRPGGRSDYENSIDDFNAIDEAYSNMMNYIRKTSPKRVISESTLKKSDTGEVMIPSIYDTDLIIRWDNTPDASKEVNETQSTADLNSSIQGYLATMAEIQRNIARTVGLSIKTIMGEDPAGANASGDALSIRENIDLKTRDNMKIEWDITLNKLTKLLMILTTQNIKGTDIYVDTMDELEMLVEFYNPSTPTFEQMVTEVRSLLDGGLIDLKTALYRLWVDTKLKSSEEVDAMYLVLQGQFKTEQEMLDAAVEEEAPEEEKEPEEEEETEEEPEDKEGE